MHVLEISVRSIIGNIWTKQYRYFMSSERLFRPQCSAT